MSLKIKSTNSPDYIEKDLDVFPPNASFFVLATLFLLISHGGSTALLGTFVLNLHPAALIALLFASATLLSIGNIAITRGHARFAVFLKILTAGHLLITLAVSVFYYQSANIYFLLTPLAASVIALSIMCSTPYRKMVEFTERRWRIYRDTGISVIEAMGRSGLKKNPKL